MAISGGDGSIILTTKIDESGLNDGLEKLRGGISGFEKALKGVAVAGAGAFVAVGTAAIKTYADFEQLSGGVQKIFDEIDYATIEKDAQEAFKTMQMSANQYLEVMTTVGANFASTLGDAKGYEVAKQGMKAITDFATGTGRSVDELSEKYQMITKSTSSYQSIADQFAGILPATSAGFLEQAQAAGFLSDSYTKLTDVPMAEYQEAVTQMLTKGVDALGLTNNAANEATTTLSGSFSMLKGSWSNLLVAFANPEQDLNLAINDLKDSLSAVADNLLPRIGEVFGSIFGSIPTPILAVASAIGAVVMGITAYNAVMEVKNVLDAIQEAGSIKLALAQIGLNTAMLASPITWVVAGIAALVAAFVILWNKSEGFRNFWIGLWEAIKAAVASVIDWIKEAFSTAWDYIKGVWEQVQPYFAAIWEGIKAVFSVVGAVLGEFFSTAWAMIKAVWDTVTGYFSAIWDTIAGIFSVVASVLSGNWSDAWEAIKGIVNTWANFFSGVWESIKSVFSAVGSWFTGIFSAAWNGVKNAWSGTSAFFGNVWNGITNVFSSVASWFSSTFTSAWNGVKNAFSSVGSFFTGVWSKIKNAFKPGDMRTIGKNIVQGLWNGINDMTAWIGNKIKSFCSNALGAIKSFFGIESPSKVMRDEVGKQIPAGMAIGIDKAKNLVTKATKALVTDTRSEAQKVLDDMNEEMLDSEKFYAEESIRIEREKEEAEYNEKLKAAKNAEERKKIELEKAEKLQEEANKKYLDDLKNTADKERKIHEARQKDIENAQKNIINAYEGAANDILDSIKDLQKKQESLADKLFDFGDIIEDVEEIEDKFSDIYSPITEKDGRYVLEKLDSQTRKLEGYLDLMTDLRDREGMSAELFDVIKNMGYEESFAYAKKLMRMGDIQFSNYIESWQKKQETSKRITEELFGDDGSMGAKRVLSDLTNQTNVLKDYYSLLEQVKNRAELPEGFFDTLRDMGIEEGLEYANALLELSDEDFANYIKAWEEKQKTSQIISKELYRDEAEQLANEIGDKFDEVEKEFFGVGENAADQFESGFIEQLKTVVFNIKGAIKGAFSNVGLGMSPNYGVDGYSIKVPALARGSVLPGGKPFLAIVNDQPRGQTNVEAPLQTIVDAMDIALNNRNSNEVLREEHYNLNETELMTILHKLVKGGERLQGKSLISGGAY